MHRAARADASGGRSFKAVHRLHLRTRSVHIWWRAGFVSICKCKCKCMPRSFSLDAAAGIRFTICSHEFPAALAKILELTRGSDRCSYLRTSCALPSTLTTPSTQHPHHPHRRLITHPPTYAPSSLPLRLLPKIPASVSSKERNDSSTYLHYNSYCTSAAPPPAKWSASAVPLPPSSSPAPTLHPRGASPALPSSRLHSRRSRRLT
jgi:hypothetical protein